MLLNVGLVGEGRDSPVTKVRNLALAPTFEKGWAWTSVVEDSNPESFIHALADSSSFLSKLGSNQGPTKITKVERQK
jgi:hypothetical protein